MSLLELVDNLSRLKEQGLFRTRRVVENAQGPLVKTAGQELISFASNDYLGLASDKRIAAAVCDAVNIYGVGAGSTHLVSGHGVTHYLVERKLAAFVGLPRALLFANGYMANLGVVSTLVNRGGAVFADRLNHASLNDAALLSRAKFHRYPHCDLSALENHLSRENAKQKLVISDAVFSMDGDLAPVQALTELCERYDAWLLLDDAHGFGVIGAEGRGALSCLSSISNRLIYIATLGKAAGVYGAFVAGASEVIEALVQRARTYIYTTATPQCLANAVLTSLEIIQSESRRRTHLVELGQLLASKLKFSRWRFLPSPSAIQPIIIGSITETGRVSEMLLEKGLWVPAIRPPTVPKNTARLRVSLSAAHSFENVERLASVLNQIESTVFA